VYLKRLELLGFKSFPDKTIVKLTPAVTSIVGPNGCGKTNILDAIRWVLGEQKVSLLRGSKMEEVIFNGTRDYKPLGMAEVTLVIQNNKGVLPTDYSEVQITRRLFRSGESEYLLNKVPCRLKDITDLLMDTGLGAHIYSVIQQDMVDAILSDRADDRRFLFEEAAGISKYKNRKKAALRKLESTEADLLRLKDIIGEVNTQVNSLSRQMKKAQRHQALSDELKKWELYLGKAAIDDFHRKSREMKASRDEVSDRKVKLETELDGLSARQEEERKRLTDIDRELSELSSQIYEKSEAAHEIEKEITMLAERRDNNRTLIGRNNLDIEAFGKRKEILAEQIQETEAELERVNRKLEESNSDLAEREGRMTAADERVLAARRERDELQQRYIDIESRLSAGKSDDTNLKQQETEIEAGCSAFREQLDKLAAGKEELTSERVRLTGEKEAIENNLEQIRSKKGEVEEQIASSNRSLEEILEKIFDTNASLEAAEARSALLNEMIAQYEGFSSGVVAVMEEADRWPDLIGPVADRFVPRTGYEAAIEAALGETAGFLVCRHRSAAEDIIGYLKNEKKGKAGFFIVDRIGSADEPTRPEVTHGGFIGWADQFTTVPDELSGLARMLLSTTAIVDAAAATEILDSLPPQFDVVTTDGRKFHGRACLSGGSTEELSLLGRKEKAASQKKVVSDLKVQLEELKEDKGRLVSKIGGKQAEMEHLRSDEENTEDRMEALERELAQVGFKLESVGNEVMRIEKERGNLQTKLESLRGRQYDLNLHYDQLAREKDDLVAHLEERETAIAELEKASEKAEADFSERQINQVELKSEGEQLSGKLRHTGELVAEIEANLNSKSEEIIRARNEITEMDEKIADLEGRLKETFEARTIISEKQAGIRDVHSGLREALDEREAKIKDIRKSREEAAARLHEIEIKVTELESEVRGIRTKATEEHGIDLDTIEAEIPDPGIPAENRTEHVRQLKDKLRDFGAVNLLALEEYNVAKERQEFLTTQIEDLLEAKSTLNSTITKINQTARRLFLETFEKVRDNFKKVFEELFTGGEADIRLVNEDDPLESAIEIIARPRGKKLLSIAQMSGGERALTAISLLFAIYLVKPSPFCILDEIDAPLDDANIHRFLKIVKTFSDQTQFIIITHNKITMESADVLYGITMEQPGISRVVSVKFNMDDEDGFSIDSSLDNGEREAKTPQLTAVGADEGLAGESGDQSEKNSDDKGQQA